MTFLERKMFSMPGNRIHEHLMGGRKFTQHTHWEIDFGVDAIVGPPGPKESSHLQGKTVW